MYRAIENRLPRPSFAAVWRERAFKLAYLLGHIPQHQDLQRALETSFTSVSSHFLAPLRFKYLRVYLARKLSFSARRACMQTHYEFWRMIGAAPRAQPLLSGQLPLWDRHGDGHVLSVELRPAGTTVAEGECALNFRVDGEVAAMLTFTIAPSAVFGMPGARVLFVGGLQGRPGAREAIRLAAKLNGEIAPFATLLLAAQALAKAWGLDGIVGIAASHQVSAMRHQAFAGARGAGAEPETCYDEFWRHARGIALAAQNGQPWGYAIPVDPQESDAVPSGSHRARTRRRRMLRAALHQEMLAAALMAFAAPGPERLFAVPMQSEQIEMCSGLVPA